MVREGLFKDKAFDQEQMKVSEEVSHVKIQQKSIPREGAASTNVLKRNKFSSFKEQEKVTDPRLNQHEDELCKRTRDRFMARGMSVTECDGGSRRFKKVCVPSAQFFKNSVKLERGMGGGVITVGRAE